MGDYVIKFEISNQSFSLLPAQHLSFNSAPPTASYNHQNSKLMSSMQRLYSHASSNDSCGRGMGRSLQSSTLQGDRESTILQNDVIVDDQDHPFIKITNDHPMPWKWMNPHAIKTRIVVIRPPLKLIIQATSWSNDWQKLVSTKPSPGFCSRTFWPKW